MLTLEHLDSVKGYQSRMACKVVTHDVIDVNSIRYAVGVDVAYRGDTAFAAAVMFDRLDGRVVLESNSISKVYIPYVPGLLFLREGAPMLMALRGLIKSLYGSMDGRGGGVGDCIILVDGNGMLHPRLFGLACYIGILMDRPTIGVSKSLLCGTVHRSRSDGCSMVMLNGREVARVIEHYGRQIYVSIGHKISLDSAESMVRSLIGSDKDKGRTGTKPRILPSSILPEPLRLAHHAANALSRSQALP